jgi:hypothetical protein
MLKGAAGFLLGAALVIVAVMWYEGYMRGKLATPALGTVIDLNPGLYRYQSSSAAVPPG